MIVVSKSKQRLIIQFLTSENIKYGNFHKEVKNFLGRGTETNYLVEKYPKRYYFPQKIEKHTILAGQGEGARAHG